MIVQPPVTLTQASSARPAAIRHQPVSQGPVEPANNIVDRIDLSPAASALPPFVHSHNDYLRKHPLEDALSSHANSVEADVHLQNQTEWHWPGLNRLLYHHDLGFHHETRFIVGHSYDQAEDNSKDLEQMYLQPLQQKIEANGGKLPGGPLTVMIELKSGDSRDASPLTAYQHLQPVLEKYKGMLTHYDHGQEVPGQVNVDITGAGLGPVRADMQKSPVRYAALDGSLSDLNAHTAPTLTPQVSADWKKVFHWNGTGQMPESERQHLSDLVAHGHLEGIRVRFWDAPDNPDTWKELVEAGAEVNTDKPIQFHQWYEQYTGQTD